MEFKMKKLEKEQLKLVHKFFKEIKFYMAKSATQGYMGDVYVDNLENPNFSFIFIERFCFIDGDANSEFAKAALESIDEYYKVIIAAENWFDKIEEVYKNNFETDYRVSIKKDTKFDKEKLTNYISQLDKQYKIKIIDDEMYKIIKETDSWVTNLGMSKNYSEYGIGFCAIKNSDEIVSVITSDMVYDDGVEINIKVKDTERQKGIATAISASMILECIKRNKYPSWDAANSNSVGLAKKLGYECDSEYKIYKINRN